MYVRTGHFSETEELMLLEILQKEQLINSVNL
jgi:hypothetical protein